MEAWIVHIRKEWIDDEKTGRFGEENLYSVWTSEKLALQKVGEFLKDEAIRSSWSNIFTNRVELQEAVVGLLESEKINAAMHLINKYTTILETKPFIVNSQTQYRVKIVVEKSEFLGSPFD